jgi:aryl carrier-like protein
VKVRGYRIEPGEIEAALREQAGVREAVVVAREQTGGEKRLVAYIVRSEETAPSASELRERLVERLPEYMTPAVYVYLDRLPLTPSGKVDRRALPEPDQSRPDLTPPYIAPRTPSERLLAEVWRQVLKLEQVGVHDNFFALGGDSILSIQIVARANQAGLRLTPKQLFEHQTIAELVAAAQYNVRVGIEKRKIEDMYPLSPMQQELFFNSLYHPEARFCWVTLRCMLRGDLNMPAFKRAWRQLVDSHPMLRTAFVWEDSDKPFQVVYKSARLPWDQQDWRELTSVEQRQRLDERLRLSRDYGLKHAEAPLMRLTVIRLTYDTYKLIWSFHQLLLDGWSSALLLREVSTNYKTICQKQEPTRGISYPYRDYITWVQQQDLSKAQAFWQETLSGSKPPALFNLMKRHGVGAEPREGHAQEVLLLGTEESSALQNIAMQCGLSLHTIITGGWGLLLSYYNQERDLVLGMTVSSRSAKLTGIESMAGLLVSTLPIRIKVSDNLPLMIWLKQLQTQREKAQEYEYAPLAQIQKWIGLPPGQPMFESIIVFDGYYPDAMLELCQTGLEIHQVDHSYHPSHHPLALVVTLGTRCLFTIAYDCRHFVSATILQLWKHFEILLQSFIKLPGIRLDSVVEILAETDKQNRILKEREFRELSKQKLGNIKNKRL